VNDADRGPWDEIPRGLGLVLDEDRGALPYSLVHGEALVACAAWALGEAGVDLVDASVPWSGLVESGEDLVLHDTLCPMTPPAFLAACLERARETGRPVVGTRPVTDTVKVVAGGVVGETLDRDRLLAIASPLVLPAAVLASLAHRPSADLARCVGDLATAGHRVETVPAPPEARRVATDEDVRLLEALTRPLR
jgi:2-C-methyl-D-erythritol 4-phosphate cytidylyltransferase